MKPFSIEHFRRWAGRLTLDSGDRWRLEPFQEAFLQDVFSGVPIAWLVVPEGNGKTTLLAGLGLYHLEFTESAYVAVAASTRDQAEWIYRQAAGFVGRSERGREFRCLEGYRRIRFDERGSRIQVFAADDRGGDGAIASLFILDELHRHKDLALYRTWSGKLGKRGGAQLVAISTAGEAGGEFEEERTRFRQDAGEVSRFGAFTRSRAENAVLHDWALEESSDPDDLEAVARANPFSGVTAETLRQKRELPGMTLAHWSRFTCNRPSRSEQAAIQETEWADASTDEEIPAGEPVWLGLDVAWKWDTTAFVPLWMPELERRLLGAATILTPPRDGSSLDPSLVEGALLDIHHRNPVHTVVMDPAKAEQLAEWIRSELGAEVVERQQTLSLQATDYERFMEGLRLGYLRHQGDAGLTRHVLNAVARLLPRGDVVFERPAKGQQHDQERRVIDALTAAAMVHAMAVAEYGVTDEVPMAGYA